MILIVALLLFHDSHCRLSTQDIIKENLAKIQGWNQEGGSDTKFAPNEFVAYTEEETKRLLGIQDVDVNFEQVVKTKSDRELEQGPPPSFDWRWFGAVTIPRFSSVQSPFLEAAINTIESAYFRVSGTLVEFSALEVEQCSTDSPDTDPVAAFKYIAKNKRLGSLAGYGSPSKCAASSTENAMKDGLVSGYTHIPEGDDNSLVNSMMRYPVFAAVRVSQKWTFYNSGILSSADCATGNPNHAVQIVAYTPAWYTVKNSWGPQWGEEGYIRLERGQGANPCGVLNYMIEPEVE